MTSETRQCPHPGCTRVIRSDFFMCATHWHALPEPDKEIVTVSYSDWQQGNIDTDQLRTTQGAVIGRVQERLNAEPQQGPPAVIVPSPGVCRSCGRNILWALTVNDKRMPLDPVPTVDGRLILQPDGRVRTLKAEDVTTPAEGMYTSHFATCANYRRKPNDSAT